MISLFRRFFYRRRLSGFLGGESAKSEAPNRPYFREELGRGYAKPLPKPASERGERQATCSLCGEYWTAIPK